MQCTLGVWGRAPQLGTGPEHLCPLPQPLLPQPPPRLHPPVAADPGEELRPVGPGGRERSSAGPQGAG